MNEDQNSPWRYKPDHGAASAAHSPRDTSAPDAKKPSAKAVEWEAPEFIEHPHGVGWYLALILVTAALAGLAYLIARDYIAAAIMIIVGIIVAVYAHQKPGQAKYEINDSGISINGKVYYYNDYKSFTVIPEGKLSSINLFPLKRFMPPLSAYFDSKDEPKIMNALGNYLPYDERKLDSIERISRRLRL
jgi:hypothetical protein